ncbi:MAG TPA: PAS domain S-box protein [Vineibacter sp.]|nr:PAS domain S-box protein [Vineibacter sp.]
MALGIDVKGAGLRSLNRIVGRVDGYATLAVSALAAVGTAGTAGLAVLEPSSNPTIASAAGLAVLAVGLVGATVLLWRVSCTAAAHHRSMVTAREAMRKVDAAQQQLSDVLNAIPLSMTLYDADERLVLINAEYLKPANYKWLDEAMIGLTIEEVATRAELQFKQAYPDLKADWKTEYLRFFRAREGADRQWADGRTMRLRQAATRSGGTVRLWVDVTDLKRNEDAAHAAQKRFDMLVGSLPDTVFSSDRAGRFNYLGGTPLLGFTPDQLLGRPARELVHPDDWPAVNDCIARMRRNRGEPVSVSFRGIGKDGAIRHLEARVTAPAAQDSLGGELAITGTIRDVQAQHEMAERLRYELRRLDSVVQSTGARILLVDRDMRIVMANREFLDAVPGRSAATVIGRPMRDVIKSPIDQAIFDAWFAAGPAEEIKGIEYENTTADPQGRRRAYHVSANPVRDEHGLVQNIVFLAVDETERRTAELQLFSTSRLATLGEMAAGVAHEINQPLTIIRFGVENLQEHLAALPAPTLLAAAIDLINDKLGRVVAQTDRAAAIITDLKSFARKSDEAPGPFDLSGAVNAAVHMLREQLRMLDVALVLDLNAECPPALGSSGRLQQVIMNLILNARDAILEGGAAGVAPPRHGTIRLRTEYAVSNGKIAAVVEDDGPGIPDKILPRLFEPFFTTKPTGKGTGLGLSVSYQIIRQMGGTIVAENRAEGGARFTVTLDAAPAGLLYATAASTRSDTACG